MNHLVNAEYISGDARYDITLIVNSWLIVGLSPYTNLPVLLVESVRA
jgi:hypothetical protein